MLQKDQLQELSQLKLKDAKTLLTNNSYDSSFYLCGYAIELALKARICITLQWDGYPSTRKEFQNFNSFKTHDLEILLRLSGIEKKIVMDYILEWSEVINWNPEIRYDPPGTIDKEKAQMMINSTQTILEAI
ncbi:MAG: hypothetical protein OMM_11210 [Candidatus Magnetoglobus multicellularis str. Araruama]|jgi:HEPN domain-containing protein|uniref:HEPN domain-containing protein n=1 Tax=Candidatus Magnetoglobus multicellularis str. Araruama TaxID=890399 RepID=A0A1V1NZ61_9BACT|nr:MAG: hypothetical protein OMM_11210 [Candidatus Magnetoglobus multicellularis str. Araruama]